MEGGSEEQESGVWKYNKETGGRFNEHEISPPKPQFLKTKNPRKRKGKGKPMHNPVIDTIEKPLAQIEIIIQAKSESEKKKHYFTHIYDEVTQDHRINSLSKNSAQIAISIAYFRSLLIASV